MNTPFNLFISLFFISYFYAVSAPPKTYTVEQPDGTVIPVQMFGHEYYSWIETLDGYVIDWVEDKDHLGWYYRDLNSDLKFFTTSIIVEYPHPKFLGINKKIREHNPALKKHTHGNAFSNKTTNDKLNKSSKTSVLKPLVFLVDFNLLPSGMPSKRYYREQFAKLIFENELESDNGSILPPSYDMSVRDYYKEISNETINIDGGLESVVDWSTVENSYSYYVDGEQGSGFGVNGISHSAAALVVELAMKIDSEYNFKDYDGNNDGDLDCVILIVEGSGNGDNDQFWPHASFIHSGINGIAAINQDAPVNSDGYFSLDGVAIKKYIVVTEQFHMNSFELNINDIYPIGTLAHEIGHIIGLPDLYDTSEKSASGIGEWGLMGSGNWNRQTSPAYMSAWSRRKIGIIQPLIIEGVDSLDEILLNPYDNLDLSSIILPLDSNMPQEYLLLENRQKKGSDQYLEGSGLLIWHIDETITEMYPALNSVNVNPDHYGVNLLQADGLGELYTESGSADDGDIFPGSLGVKSISTLTVPNTKSYSYDRDADGLIETGVDSGISIEGISEDSDGIIYFNVTSPNSLGEIIGYDEGSYTGQAIIGTAQSMQWVGIRFEAISDNLLSGIQTVFPPSYSGNNVSNYEFNIWEGWSNNVPQNLLYSSNGSVVWEPENFRDGGWAFISVLNQNISLTQGSTYYIEFNYTGSGYIYSLDNDLYLNSTNSNLSYYRSNTSESCKRLSGLYDADWNIRAVVSGEKNLDIHDVEIPQKTQIFSNYPNPFNPSTILSIYLSKPSYVEYSIFNLVGQTIMSEKKKFLKSGLHRFEIKLNNYSSGLYLYKFKIDGVDYKYNKMILLK